MPCECGCESCEPNGLLSGLSGLMGALTDPIHVGAKVSWGGELTAMSVVGDLMSTVLDMIKYELLDGEGSPYIRPTEVRHAAGVANPFIVVEGTCAGEFGQAAHVMKGITDAIESLGYRVTPGSVNFFADTYNASTGQPTSTSSAGANNTPPPPGQCNWNSQSLTDYVACQLGVTTTSAVTLGAIGALLLVVMLTRK